MLPVQVCVAVGYVQVVQAVLTMCTLYKQPHECDMVCADAARAWYTSCQTCRYMALSTSGLAWQHVHIRLLHTHLSQVTVCQVTAASMLPCLYRKAPSHSLMAGASLLTKGFTCCRCLTHMLPCCHAVQWDSHHHPASRWCCWSHWSRWSRGAASPRPSCRQAACWALGPAGAGHHQWQ